MEYHAGDQLGDQIGLLSKAAYGDRKEQLHMTQNSYDRILYVRCLGTRSTPKCGTLVDDTARMHEVPSVVGVAVHRSKEPERSLR